MSLAVAELVVTLPLLLAPPTLLLVEVVDATALVVPLVALALVCDEVVGPVELTALVLALVPPMPVAGPGLSEVEHPSCESPNVASAKNLFCRISIARSLPCVGGQPLAFTYDMAHASFASVIGRKCPFSPSESGTIR